MFQISIQKYIVNIHNIPLQVFNKHSCHHNSECDIMKHWGVVICEIHARDLAETFCRKSGMVHTIPFHLKYPSTPNQSTVSWTVSSFHIFVVSFSVLYHCGHWFIVSLVRCCGFVVVWLWFVVLLLLYSVSLWFGCSFMVVLLLFGCSIIVVLLLFCCCSIVVSFSILFHCGHRFIVLLVHCHGLVVVWLWFGCGLGVVWLCCCCFILFGYGLAVLSL